MSDDTIRPRPPEKPTREERLAAKLRENLRRRKAQAREIAAPPVTVSETDAPDESGRLPKSAAES